MTHHAALRNWSKLRHIACRFNQFGEIKNDESSGTILSILRMNHSNISWTVVQFLMQEYHCHSSIYSHQLKFATKVVMDQQSIQLYLTVLHCRMCERGPLIRKVTHLWFVSRDRSCLSLAGFFFRRLSPTVSVWRNLRISVVATAPKLNGRERCGIAPGKTGLLLQTH